MYNDHQIIIKALEKRNRRLYNDLHTLQKKNEELKMPQAFESFMADRIKEEIDKEIIKDMWRIANGQLHK